MNFTSGLSDTDQGYNASLEYLYNRLPMFSRVGGSAYKPGLDTSRELAAAFGNPERRFRSIHVGGTNGKGSTSHSLAAIFQAAGYRTGLYTSPHLVDFRERMRIDGRMIPRERVVDFVARWKALGYAGSPSFFELTMMMAFEWFADEKVDIAIIEVGMGGRLDSTNIITPELCVITNISKDHTQFLGETLPEIAAEKAGIIKPGVPVVIGEAEGEVKEVFVRKAGSEGSPLIFAEEEGNLLTVKGAAEPAGWKCCSPLCGDFTYPLGGDYQLRNLLTVLAAVKELRKEDTYRLSPEAVRQGLEGVNRLTGLAGRWTVMSERPLTICDTGHNEAGLRYNLAQLRRIAANRGDVRVRMVIGFVADKAIDDILAMMPREFEYYVTRASIPRALPVEALVAKCESAGLPVRSFPTVAEAFGAALRESAPEDILYVGGSTFIVADYLASAAETEGSGEGEGEGR